MPTGQSLQIEPSRFFQGERNVQRGERPEPLLSHKPSLSASSEAGWNNGPVLL